MVIELIHGVLPVHPKKSADMSSRHGFCAGFSPTKQLAIAVAAICLSAVPSSWAQLDDFEGGLGSEPIEIQSRGGTQFVDGLAIASGGVKIFVEDASIFSDKASYDVETNDIYLEGNVRIYRSSGIFNAERAVYNTVSKQIRAGNLAARFSEFNVRADRAMGYGSSTAVLEDAVLSPHDSSKPDFHLRARRVRIYNNDKVILSDVKLFIGTTPVFWLPYLYQPLDDAFAFSATPGFSETWGAFLLTEYAFPLGENTSGSVGLNLYSRRGLAPSAGLNFKSTNHPLSQGNISGWFLEDQDPNYNPTNLARPLIQSGRYRVEGENQTWFNDDVFFKMQLTALSDEFVLQDFFQKEFAINPQPPTVAFFSGKTDFFNVSLVGRFQLNDFFETTERLPELSLDFTRTNILGSQFFYEGTSSIGQLERSFEDGSFFPDFSTLRFDSYHQITYPGTYMGWLNVVPRVGFRATYYEDTAIFAPGPLNSTGSEFRPVIHAGMEMSFKATRTFDDFDMPELGLDGLRHVVQPYSDYSHVSNFGFSPAGKFAFDRRVASTQVDLIEFPDFTAIDQIDTWNIARIGVRNRLQTRRDQRTVNWLELDSYFNVNIDNPYSEGRLSNFFNTLRFEPLPWAALTVKSQIPLSPNGFTEINSQVDFMVTRDLNVAVGHRYLNDNPFFQDSSLLRFQGFYRINDHWSVSALEQIEISDGTLETQLYSVHRDLTSWVASVGAVIRDNGGGQTDFGVLMTFTLKSLPQVNLPLTFDPGLGSANEN